MATVFVRHKVSNFTEWKKVYDAFDRSPWKITSHGCYQLDGDPNDVTVYQEHETMDAAKAFATSSQLKEAMQNAGVVGEPDIWFTNRA